MRSELHWPARKERLLFRTYKPPSRTPEWAVGQLVEREGHIYEVTHWVSARPVSLARGGSVGEWEIWGRRVSQRRLRKEVLGAAEAILDEERQGGDHGAGDRQPEDRVRDR